MPHRLVAAFAFLAALQAGAHAERGFAKAPPCVKYGPKSQQVCPNNDGLVVEAVNHCNQRIDIQICIGLRNGKVTCGITPAVAVGRNAAYSACSPASGPRIGVSVRLIPGSARRTRPAACPDHYYRSQDPADHGKCLKCEAIWSNGHCIYD